VKRFSLEHEIHCSPQRYWELFKDTDFTRDMLLQGLGFSSCKVGPFNADGTRREIEAVPRLDVPDAVARVIGPRLGYTELGEFDDAQRTWRYRLRMSVLTERLRVQGVMRLQPTGSDRCRRVSDHEVEAKVLGVGGLLERATESNIRTGWGNSASWINGWLAARS